MYFIIPAISRLGQKYLYIKNNCNNMAIYWGDIYPPTEEDIDKTL